MKQTAGTFTQVRIARPTDQLEQVCRFYEEGLGLRQIGSFQNHDGYTGVLFGLPGEACHLEFTQHEAGSPCPAPTRDNLLVFYFPDEAARDLVADRLSDLGYDAVAPENPYWAAHGITVEDPDGWRVVLMKRSSFSAS